MNQAPMNLNREQALRNLRLLWAALILGPLVFLAVIAVLNHQGTMPGSDPQVTTLLLYVNLAMVVGAVPLGYLIRSQFYKRHWVGDHVNPVGYFTGNLVLLALCEGLAMFSLVNCLLSRGFWPAIIPAALALSVQVVNFPHGRPMQPALNPYQRSQPKP